MFQFLIPAAASIIGGALSGSGKSGTQTTKQELDPAMRPFIFDQGGLVPEARRLFERQTTDPSYTAGFADMRDRGRQLMGGSIAGNPFASGYRGGGLFGNAGSQYSYTPPPASAPPPVAPQQQQPSLQDIIAQMQAEQLRQYLMQEFMGAGSGDDGGAAAAAASAAGIGTDGGGGSAM